MTLRLGLVLLLTVGLLDAAAPPPPGNNLNGAMARFGTSRFRHVTIVPRVVWSPDNKFIATGSHLGTLRLWHPTSGELLRELNNQNGVTALAISPDAKWLASGSWDNTIRLWDVANARLIRQIRIHNGEICSLSFSPDGKRLASGAKDGTVRIVDPSTGKLLTNYATAHPGADVRWVEYSPDGKNLVSCATDKLIKLWEIGKNQPIRTIKGHENIILCARFSPDGKTLASTAHDGTTRLWNVADGKQKRLFKHPGFGEVVCFSPDGKLLFVSQGWGNQNSLYDLESPSDKPRWSGGAQHSLAVAFSPDGKKVVGTGWESTIRIWDVATGKEEGTAGIPGHTSWVYDVAPLADGRIVSAGSDHQILVWSAEGQLLRKLQGFSDRVNALAVSPDGRIVAAGGREGNVRLFDVNVGREIKKFVAGGAVKCLAFSPDGKRLASASGEDQHDPWSSAVPGHNASIWDVASGQRLSLVGHEGGVNAIVFSPDGKIAITAGNDGSVRFWDSLRGKELRQLTKQSDPVECLALSPDGSILATGMKGGTVQLWDVQTLELIHSMNAGADWIVRLAFSPDATMLVSSGKQNLQPGYPIIAWDVATGQERARFRGHQRTAFALALADQGRTILSGGADGCVALWDVTLGYRGVRQTLSPIELKRAWNELIGSDTKKVHQAIWELTTTPNQVLPLLREALKPVPRADAKHIAKLARDLDDEDFSTRQRATEALEGIGDPAAPTLKKVYEEGSAEAANRARRLLDLLQTKAGSERRLREARGVEILERIGSVEARKILKVLADGAPEAAVTKESRAALARLTRDRAASLNGSR